MFLTARRCSVLLLLATSLLATLVVACGGGKSSPSGSVTPAPAADINGTYVVVQDSDGTRPKAGATVTLVLDKGTLSLRAVSADEELTDSGTYSISDGRMTIAFKEQGISATDQPYKLDGDTLEIPVKMFGEGAGSSTWKRGEPGAADAQPTASDDAAAAVDAPRAPGGLSALQANWSLFDDKYATAQAMKTYVESVNDKHMTWEAAVRAAAERAKSFADVTGVDISPNGLNAVIHYKDGHDEDLLTERMTLTEGGISASGEQSSEPYVSAAPVAAPTPQSACAELPAAPIGGAVKTSRGRIVQPGREGLQPSQPGQVPGLFGVSNYNAQRQPKPINSTDSPPVGERNALLFAPLYDVPHPGPVYKGDGLGHSTWSGFREGSGGNNIECITAALKRGGYAAPETILGRIEKGKQVQTGIDALVELTKKLTSTKYGVIYIMTHGAATEAGTIKLQMGTLSDEDRRAVIGERKIRHEDETTLEDAIREKVLREAGLPLDDDLKKTIRADVEIDGKLGLWVSSDYFRLLREMKGLSFANTLIIVNACSSAANQGLVKAFEPKAFFGFERPPDLQFSSDAAQEIIDLLPDKARSARNAWMMWVRYHEWLQAISKVTPSDRVKVSILKAYGKFGVEYAPITEQSAILIFRMRHGPTSGAADITKSISFIQSCWSSKKKDAFAISCHALELGGHLPTEAEVADAVFEVGGGGDAAFGRWTLAD